MNSLWLKTVLMGIVLGFLFVIFALTIVYQAELAFAPLILALMAAAWSLPTIKKHGR